MILQWSVSDPNLSLKKTTLMHQLQQPHWKLIDVDLGFWDLNSKLPTISCLASVKYRYKLPIKKS
ncbi:hypothetical protein HanRHA438_Chr13g0604771 [Helianthus annuus]|nr:hypothetical protein HanRHA438_Chr13g0604771 [Helianthus annuus]